jgi:hypothetical protein
VQAQLRPRVGKEVRDEDVGRREETIEHRPPIVAAQVDGDAAFVAVELFEQEVEVAGVGDQAHGLDAPQRVAGRSFDLDDVGAPLGEHRGGAGHEPVLGDLDHAYAVEHAHRVQPRSAGSDDRDANSTAPSARRETSSPMCSNPSPSVLPMR